MSKECPCKKHKDRLKAGLGVLGGILIILLVIAAIVGSVVGIVALFVYNIWQAYIPVVIVGMLILAYWIGVHECD